MSETGRYRKKNTPKRAGGVQDRVEDGIADGMGDGAGAATVMEAVELPRPPSTPFDDDSAAPPPPPGFPELPTDRETAPGLLNPRASTQFPVAPSGPALVTQSGRPVANLSDRSRGGPGHATQEEHTLHPPPRVRDPRESAGEATPTGGRGISRQSASGDSMPVLGKTQERPRGRVGAHGPGVGPGVNQMIDPLPRPPMYDFSPDPGGFFKYWASMPPDRTLVYVYRNWPVWDPMLLLTQEERIKVSRKEMRVITNIGKLNQPWDPKHWEHEIFHRFGSGDYHFKLNDLASSRAVCMTTVRGLRDFDNYPPVLDRRAVVMTDPANSSYIERMRLRGMKFPGDPGAEAEEDEMSGTADAMRDMAQTVDKLTDRVLNQRPPGVDVRGQGDLRAVEAVAEGAKRGYEFLSSAMSTLQASQAKAQDPKAYLQDVMETARMFAPAPAPPPDPNAGNILQTVTTMFTQMMAIQQQGHSAVLDQIKERLAFTERMAADANNRAMAPPAAAPNPTGAPVVNGTGTTTANRPPSMLEELERLIKLKDRLDELGGGGAGGGGSTPGWAPYALQGLSILATAGQNIAANLAAARGAMPVQPQPIPQGLPGSGDGEDQEQLEAGAEFAPPQQGGDMNGIAFAQKLHGPLVKALNDGAPGYEFAARMIVHEGAMVYHYLASQGKDGIVRLMQMYPPLWGDVIRYGAHVETFLDEFLDREQALELAEEMRIQAQTGTPPPHPAPQAVRMTPRAQSTAPVPSTAPGPRVTPRSEAPQTPREDPDTQGEAGRHANGQSKPHKATSTAPAGPRKVVRPDGSAVEVLPPDPGAHKAPRVNASPAPQPAPQPAPEPSE